MVLFEISLGYKLKFVLVKELVYWHVFSLHIVPVRGLSDIVMVIYPSEVLVFTLA